MGEPKIFAPDLPPVAKTYHPEAVTPLIFYPEAVATGLFAPDEVVALTFAPDEALPPVLPLVVAPLPNIASLQQTITTNPVTRALGGVTNSKDEYFYLWEVVSGSAVTIASPNSRLPGITGANLGTTTIRRTVTDDGITPQSVVHTFDIQVTPFTDTTPPELVVTSQTDGEITTEPYLLTFTVNEPSEVEYDIGAGWVLIGSNLTSGDEGIPFAHLQTQTINVRATDASDNVSDTEVVTLRLVKPLQVNAPADVSDHAVDGPLTLTGTAQFGENAGGYTYQWSGPASVTFDSPNSASTGVTFNSGGDLTLTFTATDGDGNSQSDTILVSVIDTGARFVGEYVYGDAGGTDFAAQSLTGTGTLISQSEPLNDAFAIVLEMSSALQEGYTILAETSTDADEPVVRVATLSNDFADYIQVEVEGDTQRIVDLNTTNLPLEGRRTNAILNINGAASSLTVGGNTLTFDVSSPEPAKRATKFHIGGQADGSKLWRGGVRARVYTDGHLEGSQLTTEEDRIKLTQLPEITTDAPSGDVYDAAVVFNASADDAGTITVFEYTVNGGAPIALAPAGEEITISPTADEATTIEFTATNSQGATFSKSATFTYRAPATIATERTYGQAYA